MKEAIGGIPLFQIVVLFILLFTGIMCLTINHAKAFGVKDEIINVIEETDVYELKDTNDKALSAETLQKIAEILKDVGYRSVGDCPNGDGWIGYDREGHVSSSKSAFCIQAMNVTTSYDRDVSGACNGHSCTPVPGGFPPMYYYNLALFYQLDVPLLAEINFRIYGASKTLFG